MSTLVIDYTQLEYVSYNAKMLSARAGEYGDSLTSKVSKSLDNLTYGANENTTSANYYVKQKIDALYEKEKEFINFSTKINTFLETAKRVDTEVASAIALNQESFLKENEHLQISEWKADIINWLVDVKNKFPVLTVIADLVGSLGTAISSALDNIKYWYKCQGGKEILSFIGSIALAVAAMLIAVASFPASGFVAICAAISAVISAINSAANVYTSFQSMIMATSGDPSWAKIYGSQDKLSDIFKFNNFGNGTANKVLYGLGTALDATELFCDAVNIVSLVKKFKFSFEPLQNLFNGKTGVMSYLKTAKWKEALDYDELGNICGVKKVLDEKDGVVQTKYTVKSVIRGVKAIALNSPIDAHTEKGVRTLLLSNFTTDFKTYKQTRFSLKALKDTVRYSVSNSNIKGVFCEGLKWKDRRYYISKLGKDIKATDKALDGLAKYVVGDATLGETLLKRGQQSVDILKIPKKFSDCVDDGKNFAFNTFPNFVNMVAVN